MQNEMHTLLDQCPQCGEEASCQMRQVHGLMEFIPVIKMWEKQEIFDRVGLSGLTTILMKATEPEQLFRCQCGFVYHLVDKIYYLPQVEN